MKTKHIFLFSITGLFMVACSAPPIRTMNNKPAKPFEIEFIVVQGGNKLKIVTPDNGCNKNENGCMRVPKVNSGDITFKFQNVQQLPCSAHANSWILSKIELANIEGDFGQQVNNWIVEDFGAVKATGLVWVKGASEEKTSVTIIDKNEHSGIAYYLVTAKSCGSSSTLDSDPRIINEGGSNLS